jgi:hypothetical protein
MALGSGFAFGTAGQLYLTGGTVTSGHVAGLGAEISGSSGTVGSPQAFVDLIYAQNSTGVVNSFLKGYGGTTYAFDLSTGGIGNQLSTTCTPANIGATGAIRVLVEGVVKYIPLVAVGTCP